MSCIVNGQTLLENESIFNDISKNKFEQFLIYLFETLLPRKLKIDRDIFSKLFYKIPYLPRMKLFDYLRKDNYYESHLIRLEDLIENLILIIFGTIEEKMYFVINFFNFNNDQKIYYEDVKLTFYYFHLFTLRKDEISLDKIIDNSFNGKDFLTQNEFLNLIKNKNSDLFYLLLFSFNQTFFHRNDLKIIHHNINDIYYKTYTQVSFLYETLSNPSKNLFEYINDNYNLDLQYHDDSKGLDELNELNSFENDFKAFRSTLMSSNNISEDEDYFKNKKKVTSFSETKCNIKFFPSLSSDYKINTHNSPTQHIYSTCLNNRIINLTLNEDNDFKKIAIEIYGINYECKIIYSENYLIVKYNSEKKERKFLVIPFNLSFLVKLNKEKNQKNYEVIIKNQIPRYEKEFIFKFISENDRNTFYDKMYLLTKSFEIESKFNFIEELGNGEFGTTYLATKKVQNNKKNSINLQALIEIKNTKIEKILGKKYAIKVLKKKVIQKRDNNNIFNRNEVEISKILVRIKHKNIINIQKVLEDVNNIYIIMEYCPKKNININELSQIEKLKQITQIINGIKFLHKLGIVHRDLKLNHLLIGEDNNIRIIDYGYSSIISPYSFINDIFGSFGDIFPPEILEKKPYSFPVDYWNIGVISYYYLYNNYPFEDLKNVNDIKNFNLYKFLFDNCDNNNINTYDNSIKNIILSCMKIDVNNRGKDLDNYLINI